MLHLCSLSTSRLGLQNLQRFNVTADTCKDGRGYKFFRALLFLSVSGCSKVLPVSLAGKIARCIWTIMITNNK